MSHARVFLHPKTAMQSGRAGTGDWVLEWEPAGKQVPDPLMGWIGQGDTQAQVRLRFATREDAVAYAERRGLSVQIELPPVKRERPKAYADNFRVRSSRELDTLIAGRTAVDARHVRRTRLSSGG